MCSEGRGRDLTSEHVQIKLNNGASVGDSTSFASRDFQFNKAIDIASLAVQAILYEASCQPSPGLVSRTSSGAHNDMNYFTFLDSASALISPLIYCAEAGFSSDSPKDIFKKIRGVGQAGEGRMFDKTRGVNTHKGTLFLLGICCAAGAKILYSGARFSSLQGIIKDMTTGLVEEELSSRISELEQIHPSMLTHGEKLYLTYKVEGIRGEVQRGLPIVFDVALKVYKENCDLSPNDRLVQTLLAIMQFCEDTNILHRHSLAILKEVQERAKRIIALGGVKTSEGKKEIEVMDKDFCKRNIGPGGSADLLGVTVFCALLEEYMAGGKLET